MTELLYVIGAGASTPMVPIVKDVGDRIDEQCRLLDRFFKFNKITHVNCADRPIEVNAALRHYAKALKVLKSIKHPHTFDAHARQLYKDNKFSSKAEAFVRFKAALVAFFTIEQGRNLHRHGRYTHFFEELIMNCDKGRWCIPSNVKILSWNYDHYPAVTLGEIKGHHDILHISRSFGITTIDQYDGNGFSVMHLNGMIGNHEIEGATPLIPSRRTTPIDFISKALACVLCAHRAEGLSDTSEIALRFSFEAPSVLRENLAKVRAEIADVHTIVVIGYSFPLSNAVIDGAVLSELTKVQKVIIQARTTGPQIWESMKGRNPRFRDSMLQIITDPAKFVLPEECGVLLSF